MAHAPARLFRIVDRGFVREGYHADLVLVDPNNPWVVSKDNILYKCGWSPFEGHRFGAKVIRTYVNGELVYENGKVSDIIAGQRLSFKRN
jgi:dihydroorotase